MFVCGGAVRPPGFNDLTTQWLNAALDSSFDERRPFCARTLLVLSGGTISFPGEATEKCARSGNTCSPSARCKSMLSKKASLQSAFFCWAASSRRLWRHNGGGDKSFAALQPKSESVGQNNDSMSLSYKCIISLRWHWETAASDWLWL